MQTNSSRQLRNTSILVTGGAGFIGSHLCETLLRQNNHLNCLDNFSTGKMDNLRELISHPSFHLFEGDIRNPEDCRIAVRGCTYVLHQAALGSVPRSVEDPMATNEVNVSGFINMLWAAKEAGVKRFIYASSSSTYGDADERPSSEEHTGFPLSPYAVSKQTNELYAGVFSKLYGIETIGLRYFNVFGPRQDPDGPYAAAIPKFLHALWKGKHPLIYGDGTQTRDFTYVANVVAANQLAALTKNPRALNQVYNIAYGSCISINEVVEQIKSILSLRKSSVSGLMPAYTKPRSGEVKHSYASIKKAKALLDYRPEYDFKTGLNCYIEWFLLHSVIDQPENNQTPQNLGKIKE